MLVLALCLVDYVFVSFRFILLALAELCTVGEFSANRRCDWPLADSIFTLREVSGVCYRPYCILSLLLLAVCLCSPHLPWLLTEIIVKKLHSLNGL